MLNIDGIELKSRFFIGTALYDSPEIMEQAVEASEAQVVTLSLRRATAQSKQYALQHWLKNKQDTLHLLPNTAGCHTAKEAINMAILSRELLQTHWIKLEVIGNEYNLQPDPFQLVEASKELANQGFKVFPYCTDDLVLCERLVEAGCDVLMPWGAPIGTGQGLMNPYALKQIRQHFPNIPLVIDAGIGKPSHAAQAMEMGYDAVLLNSAVAQSMDPVKMAKAFKHSIEAGRLAYEAGCMEPQDMAQPSTPEIGKPFWHTEGNTV